ncbi:MAG: OmpH family outer membrane protein [Syntrophobacteria bacterium]
MRILTGVFAGLLFLTVSTQVWAAEVIRLGFFDKQAIVDRSEMGKEGLEKLRGKMGPIREKLNAARQEIEELEAEFKKKELVWSDDMKKNKLQEIRAKKVMLRQGVDQANRLLTEKERELLMPLQKKVVEIVARIGKEEGYAMIFELGGGGIWYAPDSLNLSERIVQELNEFYAGEKAKQ